MGRLKGGHNATERICCSYMYSHGSCFKLKEPKKVKTNAEKFEEVFGHMPEVFNAVRGTGLDDWWNEPYKEEDDD